MKKDFIPNWYVLIQVQIEDGTKEKRCALFYLRYFHFVFVLFLKVVLFCRQQIQVYSCWGTAAEQNVQPKRNERGQVIRLPKIDFRMRLSNDRDWHTFTSCLLCLTNLRRTTKEMYLNMRRKILITSKSSLQMWTFLKLYIPFLGILVAVLNAKIWQDPVYLHRNLRTLSVCLSVCLFVWLFVCICLSICLSVCLFVWLFVCICLFDCSSTMVYLYVDTQRASKLWPP